MHTCTLFLCTYVDQARVVTLSEVVQNTSFIEVGQTSHILDLLEFWWIHLLCVIDVDLNLLQNIQILLHLQKFILLCALSYTSIHKFQDNFVPLLLLHAGGFEGFFLVRNPQPLLRVEHLRVLHQLQVVLLAQVHARIRFGHFVCHLASSSSLHSNIVSICN